MIVPKLTNVLKWFEDFLLDHIQSFNFISSDTHFEVQTSARDALGHIGSVIRNPEIQAHVPVILKALDDPDAYTREAMDALIHTSFVHSIDAPPSLSLIIPILHRALRDRITTESKKKAAQIVGNMCSLTEHKDLEPYLEVLIVDLKEVLIDPIPEVIILQKKKKKQRRFRAELVQKR